MYLSGLARCWNDVGQRAAASGGGLHACWVAARLTCKAPSMCPACEMGFIRASVPLCRVAAHGSDGLRGLQGKHARLVAVLWGAHWPSHMPSMEDMHIRCGFFAGLWRTDRSGCGWWRRSQTSSGPIICAAGDGALRQAVAQSYARLVTALSDKQWPNHMPSIEYTLH